MVEIMDGRVGKRSVERVWYVANKHFITLSHFTHSVYLHSPSARENTDATYEITHHISH